MRLNITPPKIFKPLWQPAPYKLSSGGRASGKSWERADALIVELLKNPDKRAACLRETGVSLDESVKVLIEKRMRQHGVDHLFEFQSNRILSRQGDGRIIFKGIQSHNADSVRGLEGVKRIWFEEAQNTSAHVLNVLMPTIRADDAEVWFTWNPEDPDAPIEEFAKQVKDSKKVIVHSTYKDNPFCPDRARDLAEAEREHNPENYRWIWLGEFRTISEAKVFAGRYKVQEFEPQPHWDGPYFGADWGFSQDPTVLVKLWVADKRLWLEYEAGGVEIDITDIPRTFYQVPGVKGHWILADNSRPETINYLHNRDGLKVAAAKKWSGSVEDGIEYLKGEFEDIIIHPRCTMAREEFAKYSYKVDRHTGRATPKLVDAHNHCIDAIRYALDDMINSNKSFILLP